MIKPDMIKIHFSEISGCKCGDYEWVMCPAEDVNINLDLETDEYIFITQCKACNERVRNTRRIK